MRIIAEQQQYQIPVVHLGMYSRYLEVGGYSVGVKTGLDTFAQLISAKISPKSIDSIDDDEASVRPHSLYVTCVRL